MFVTLPQHELLQKIDDRCATGPVILMFVYFFCGHMHGLRKKPAQRSQAQQAYCQALSHASFVLPDGIALRLLRKKRRGSRLPNHNGTDFIPQLLTSYNHQGRHLVCYGGPADRQAPLHEYLTTTYSYASCVVHEGYTYHTAQQLIPPTGPTIVLVGTGAPRQEQRIADHTAYRDAFPYPIIVASVGGLFDYRTKKEKRAPLRVRKRHGEWLRRSLRYPGKNAQKTILSLTLFRYLFMTCPLHLQAGQNPYRS